MLNIKYQVTFLPPPTRLVWSQNHTVNRRIFAPSCFEYIKNSF